MIFRPFLQDYWKSLGKRNYFFLFLLVLSLSGCTHSVSMAGMNHLKTEKSPYLRQHADNPVWWYAWGDEAFIRAKKENKLVFLSVGYSTCHWCHVMERESFSDQTVADALNHDFIAIKVDREERPDIDAIYMDAVQAMTGSGGWPMNVILTPDRVPFFGGTYFPKPQLLEVLGKISGMWRSDPGKIHDVAGNLENWIKEQKSETLGTKLTHEVFGTFLKTFERSFDQAQGGRQGRPKFVPSYELRVLLRIHRRTGNEKSLQMVKTTLDHIARGGIYDHIGGGFHRYSTDDHWLVPHFEKMLYDQAALVRAYTEAFEVTRDPEYEAVVRETLDYILRDMTSPDGAFYSAEDADSEGIEGKFYVWKENEIRGLLNKEEYSEFKKAYGVTSTGNFEDGTNILNLQTGFSKHDRSKVLQSAIGKLANARSKRVRPARDEKVLTSWNGLMISAMAEAGRVFDDLKYKDAAAKAANFILAKSKTKELLHRWINGDAKYEAQAEDYAFFIDGLLSVYQANWDPKFCLEAARLQEEQNALFPDQNSGAYFETTGKDKTLLRRGKNFLDNVIPSANSVALLNLLRLSAFMMNRDYLDRAGRLLSSFPKQAQSFPTAFPQMMMGLDYFLDRSKEVVIIGNIADPNTEKFVREVTTGFHPNRVIAVGSGDHELIPLLKNRPMKDEKATAYVCVGQVCQLPTTDPRKAHEIASQIEKISW